MKSPLCLIGLHKWHYIVSKITNLVTARECERCGRMEISYGKSYLEANEAMRRTVIYSLEKGDLIRG